MGKGEENSPPITERIAYCGKKSKISLVCFDNKAGRVELTEPLNTFLQADRA